MSPASSEPPAAPCSSWSVSTVPRFILLPAHTTCPGCTQCFLAYSLPGITPGPKTNQPLPTQTPFMQPQTPLSACAALNLLCSPCYP